MELEHPEGQWGLLRSLNPGKHKDIPLNQDKVSLGRLANNTVQLSDLRLSGVHCEILKQDNIITLFDKSSNGTFIDNYKIGKMKARLLNNNDIIYLLHEGPKVPKNEIIGYKFLYIEKQKAEQQQLIEMQKQREKERKEQEEKEKLELQQKLAQKKALDAQKSLEEQKKKAEEDLKEQKKQLEIAQQKMEEEKQKQLDEMKKQLEEQYKKELEDKKQEHLKEMEKMKENALLESQKLKQQQQDADNFEEDFECCICMEIIYQCVTLNPCLHNMCGSCASEWLQKKDLCPTCNNKVDKVRKNPTLNNIIDKYVQKHPEKKWNEDIVKDMEKKNRIHKVEMTIKEIVDYNPLNNSQAQNSQNSLLQTAVLNDDDNDDDLQLIQVAPIQQKKIRKTRKTSKKKDDNLGGFGMFGNNNINNNSMFNIAPPPPHMPQMNFGGFGGGIGGRLSAPIAGPFGGLGMNPFGGANQLLGGVNVYCENCAVAFGGTNKDKCILCQNYFCNLSKFCGGKSQLKVLTVLKDAKVPAMIHMNIFKGNKTEASVLQKHLVDKNITTQDVYKFMMEKYISKNSFWYEENQKIHDCYMGKGNRKIFINENQSICGSCFQDLWFQILFRYRMEIKDQLEFPYNFTEVCPFGLNCRTVQHNKEHEQQFDHICEQSKF